MKEISWNPVKSKRLKMTRGVSFEEILASKYVTTIEHPRKAHQWIMVFQHKNDFWAVPFVEDADEIFLKTIYPSRKLKRRFGGSS